MSDKIIQEPTVNDYIEKPRVFRDRTSKEKRTKEKLALEEKTHPVHEPYKREKLKWVPTTAELGDEEIEESYLRDDGFE